MGQTPPALWSSLESCSLKAGIRAVREVYSQKVALELNSVGLKARCKWTCRKVRDGIRATTLLIPSLLYKTIITCGKVIFYSVCCNRCAYPYGIMVPYLLCLQRWIYWKSLFPLFSPFPLYNRERMAYNPISANETCRFFFLQLFQIMMVRWCTVD